MKKFFIPLIVILLFLISYFTYKYYITDKYAPRDMYIYKGNAKFIKNLGKPFSSPGVELEDGIFGLYGDMSEEIMTLDDGTEMYVEGYINSVENTIPEAGEFRKIEWKVIDITSYKIK